MSIDRSDIEYVLSDYNILNKDYSKYIINVIETTSIILNQLELLKDNKSTCFRVNRQIERGMNYLKKLLEFIEEKKEYKRIDRMIRSRNNYINKTIGFLRFLVYHELVDLTRMEEYEDTVKELQVWEKYNILIEKEDKIKFFKDEILSFECLLDWGNHLDSYEDMDGYNGLINLFNTPTKNNILKAAIYHISRIFFDNELEQTSDLRIDYGKKENQEYLKKSSEIIINLFKNYGGRMNYISYDFNPFYFTEEWTGFRYKKRFIGLITQLPKHRTGYSPIGSYYSYNLNTKTGYKSYWFPSEPLNFNF